jgi:hypothetical protein
LLSIFAGHCQKEFAMIIRGSRVRLAIAGLLLGTGLLLPDVATASSITSLQPDSAAAETLSTADGTAPQLPLTLAETTGSDLDFVANVGAADPQPEIPLALDLSYEFPGLPSTDQQAATFLTAASPLTVSDVPEPTAFGLLLLGLAGLFFARRIARKA